MGAVKVKCEARNDFEADDVDLAVGELTAVTVIDEEVGVDVISDSTKRAGPEIVFVTAVADVVTLFVAPLDVIATVELLCIDTLITF